MLNFNQFNKNKEKKDYEIVKSRSGLPMFVLDSPFTQDDDESILVDDDPVKKKSKPNVISRVCDYISVHSF